MKPEGRAVLGVHVLTQAGPWGPDVLTRPLPSEDPFIQTAGGQDVFLIETTERQAEDRETWSEEAGGRRTEDIFFVLLLVNHMSDTHKLSPKFMGSRKPVRLSSFPLRICGQDENRDKLSLCPQLWPQSVP